MQQNLQLVDVTSDDGINSYFHITERSYLIAQDAAALLAECFLTILFMNLLQNRAMH